jgi:hypothetical protein
MANTGGDRGGNNTGGRAGVRARGARVLASELEASPVARFGRPLKIFGDGDGIGVRWQDVRVLFSDLDI